MTVVVNNTGNKLAEQIKGADHESRVERMANFLKSYVQSYQATDRYPAASAMSDVLGGEAWKIADLTRELRSVAVDLLAFFSDPDITEKYTSSGGSPIQVAQCLKRLHWFSEFADKNLYAELALSDFTSYAVSENYLKHVEADFKEDIEKWESTVTVGVNLS